MLPSSWLQFFGKSLGTFAFYCVPIRKKHALESLHKAFPEKSSVEITSILRRLYQNLGKMLIRYNIFSESNPQKLVDNFIFEGEEILKKALAQKKGVVVTGGHMGDWETMGVTVATCGYEVSCIVAPIRNPFLNDLITTCRARSGLRLISKKGMAIRRITKDLKENRCLSILVDQDAGKTGVFVDFFGRPASAPQGPAFFALKRGVPIVLAISFYQPDGRLKLIVEELKLPDTNDDFIQKVTQEATSRLEYYIRKHPDQWFGWLHRRWKTKPPA